MSKLQITTKQAEYIRNAHHRWNLAIGAVRSGKSHLAVQLLIPQGLLERSKKKGINLILGATRDNIERNVLTPMRDIWGERLVGGIKSDNTSILFGEKVYCLGGENVRQVSKIRGSEVKFCYCDEVCDINQEVFDILKSRLSLSYSVFHGAANPTSPQHYVKKFIDAPELDTYVQKYEIWDNPFLPADYIKNLEAEYAGTVYYDRYILGLWTQAEGLVYPHYQTAFEPTFVQKAIEYCVSCDYGTQNAFAALLWAFDGTVWHCLKEYRYSGRDEGHQKTDEDYVLDLQNFMHGYPEMRVIVDPSAASFIAALRRSGITTLKGHNEVADGIRDVASAIQLGLIRISDACNETKKEFAGYVWDDKAAVDTPVKTNDHLMDALRYFVRSKRIVKHAR